MSTAEQVLVSHPDPSWLPHGSRADVVLVGPRAEMPATTCMVRLLATRQGEVFAVPRADGNGLDIPTRRVGSAAPEECLETLLVSALGAVHPTFFLGYVRNVGDESTDDYEWPVPDAYFAVSHCDLPADCEVAEGQWLGAREAKRRLGDRHWWPLAAKVVGGRVVPPPWSGT